MDILDSDDVPFHPGSGLTAAAVRLGSVADLQMDGGASAQFDPIHMLSNWNLVQRQEAAARLAAESMEARAGRGRIDGLASGLCRSGPNVLSRSGYFSSLGTGGLTEEYCDSREIKEPPPPAASLESLDRCLLSATNSNTDASVADDEISMLYPADCNSLWCFNAGDAVSSGDLACRDDALVRTGSVSDADPYSDFNFISEEFQPRLKKRRAESRGQSSSNINFQQPSSSASSVEERDTEAMAQMKEMIYRAAAFRPVNFGAEVVEKPKRKNVRISTDPQTVAARKRRERISERIRVLQRLVPGGSKMDTASMLDEAANYLKYLRSQVKALEALSQKKMESSSSSSSLNFDPLTASSSSLHINNFSYPMQPNFSLHSHNPIQRTSS